MNLSEVYKKVEIKISLPTFRKIVLNDENLKKVVKTIKNKKRNTYIVLDEEKVLNFFKA